MMLRQAECGDVDCGWRVCTDICVLHTVIDCLLSWLCGRRAGECLRHTVCAWSGVGVGAYAHLPWRRNRMTRILPQKTCAGCGKRWQKQSLRRQRARVPVGAVLVAGGILRGRGHNQREHGRDATLHAEMIAISQCVWQHGWLAFARGNALCHVGAVPDVRRRGDECPRRPYRLWCAGPKKRGLRQRSGSAGQWYAQS